MVKTVTSQKMSITDLPFEMIVSILSWLNNKDLRSTLFVNKFWRQATEEVRKIREKYYPKLQKINYITDFNPLFVELKTDTSQFLRLCWFCMNYRHTIDKEIVNYILKSFFKNNVIQGVIKNATACLCVSLLMFQTDESLDKLSSFRMVVINKLIEFINKIPHKSCSDEDKQLAPYIMKRILVRLIVQIENIFSSNVLRYYFKESQLIWRHRDRYSFKLSLLSEIERCQDEELLKILFLFRVKLNLHRYDKWNLKKVRKYKPHSFSYGLTGISKEKGEKIEKKLAYCRALTRSGNCCKRRCIDYGRKFCFIHRSESFNENFINVEDIDKDLLKCIGDRNLDALYVKLCLLGKVWGE